MALAAARPRSTYRRRHHRRNVRHAVPTSADSRVRALRNLQFRTAGLSFAPQLVVLARSALSRPRAGRTFMRHSRHWAYVACCPQPRGSTCRNSPLRSNKSLKPLPRHMSRRSDSWLQAGALPYQKCHLCYPTQLSATSCCKSHHADRQLHGGTVQ